MSQNATVNTALLQCALLLTRFERAAGASAGWRPAILQISPHKIKRLQGKSVPLQGVTLRRNPQGLDCVTTNIGPKEPVKTSHLSAFRKKDKKTGRQECLPHLHARFLDGSTIG